jgi:hypothetical protein
MTVEWSSGTWKLRLIELHSRAAKVWESESSANLSRGVVPCVRSPQVLGEVQK